MSKKRMRQVRVLKRSEKRQEWKTKPNRKERGHYVAKRKAELIARRTNQFDFELPPELRRFADDLNRMEVRRETRSAGECG